MCNLAYDSVYSFATRMKTVLRSTIQASVLLQLLLMPMGAQGQVFSDPGFVSETIASLPPFTPVGIAFAPDGRLFIWQKSGLVRLVKNGSLLPTPFLNIQSQVNQCSDRGLLGLALDPNFTTNRFVYLLYTVEGSGNPNDCGPKVSRLTRISADPLNPDVALAGSETVIINNIPSDGDSHSVGSLRFGPDGKLFVSHGDGASYNFADPLALRAQDLNSFNGKILRINPDGSAPGDNPFDDGTNSVRSKVWAYGLRNPFRFALSPVTGEPYIGDVGWNTWEELNRGRGANFGWPCYEGNGPQPSYQAAFLQCRQLSASAVTNPLFTYNHSTGSTVVGGAFYTGFQYPSQYRGNLFFADYTAQWISRLIFDANNNVTGVETFATNVGGPVTIEMGPDGMLYFVEILTGQVKRIRYSTGAEQPPIANASATPVAGYSPLTVNFSSVGSADPEGGPISYLWDFGDGATSTAANPQHTYISASVRTFGATLSVTDIAGMSASVVVDVTVGSLPPVVNIDTPADGTLVSPGQSVTFHGGAIDPDDGNVPAAALSWKVFLHHNEHVHLHQTITGTGGSFLVTDHGVGNFAFELVLTATDSSGLTDTKRVFLPLPAVGTPDVVAAYSFNEDFGSVVNDSAGNGNDGDITGASWTAQAVFGGALSFDGLSDFVSVADNATLDLGGTGTIEAWVRLNALGLWHGVIAKGNINSDPAHNYALEITDANRVRCILGNGTGGQLLDSTITVTTGQFRHLACTWNGTTLSLYIDGVVNASTAQNLTPVGNTSPLFIGQFGGNSDRLSGIIDEVRIYNRALSQAEIQFDMNTPIVTVANTAPTISVIGPQATNEDTATGAIAFTVGDTETPVGSLTVSSSSSNTTLVPNGNIAFGGSGANRTVTVTPAANQNGSANITVTVSDGSLNTPTSFQLAVNPVNDAPTISNIANQTTTTGSSIGPLSFTVGDVETAAASLTLSGSSNNTTLVPNTNITFGGSGANRTVTVTPAAGHTGTATITVTVSDGSLSTPMSFQLTVLGANTAPTISAIGPQATNEDTVTGAIPFTVGDTETAAGSLAVSGSSSNTAVIPNGNIVFGGSGANRTVTVTPAANQNGSANITVTVSDGSLSTPTSFQLTVNPVNDAPTISNIANQTTTTGTAIGPLSFTVGDVETAAASLTLSGSSNNTALVPNGNIVFGGTGANRTVTVTPAAGQTGTANITVTVSDGSSSTPTSFQLTVNAVPSGLRAAYAFQEGSGTTTADASGSLNTGTLTNGPVWTTQGKYGNAITFDGVNDFVSVSDSATLDLGGTGTIEAWVRLNAINRWNSVVAKGNQNNDARHNYALEITDTNRVRCILSTGTGNNFIGLDSSQHHSSRPVSSPGLYMERDDAVAVH